MLAQALKRGKAFVTSQTSFESDHKSGSTFQTAPEGKLFPKVDPLVDGEDCDHDCTSCEVLLPKNFKIDEHQKLYGHVNGWATHMLVATGKTDWVKDITNEKGSVMEAVKDSNVEPSNGVRSV